MNVPNDTVYAHELAEQPTLGETLVCLKALIALHGESSKVKFDAGANSISVTVEPAIARKAKPETFKASLHPMAFCSVRIEVRPAHSRVVTSRGTFVKNFSLQPKSDPGDYFLRLVARNGKVLFHSEIYSGGVSKAIKRAQSLVDAWQQHEVLCNVHYAIDNDPDVPSSQIVLSNSRAALVYMSRQHRYC